MDSAIRTCGLTRYYGRTPGVIDVDLDVPAGLVVGFLGPNGAVAGLVEDLAGAVKLSPIWMYSGTETIVGGLSVGKTSTMAALGVAAIVLAGFFFERRDVRS